VRGGSAGLHRAGVHFSLHRARESVLQAQPYAVRGSCVQWDSQQRPYSLQRRAAWYAFLAEHFEAAYARARRAQLAQHTPPAPVDTATAVPIADPVRKQARSPACSFSPACLQPYLFPPAACSLLFMRTGGAAGTRPCGT
jgi:hypothetical protein